MEQFKGGGQHKRGQEIIDDLLAKANKKATEILGRTPKLPEEKLRPVIDSSSRPEEAQFEHAGGVHVVGQEELSGDDKAGDKADQWLNEHDPERRKGKQEGTV